MKFFSTKIFPWWLFVPLLLFYSCASHPEFIYLKDVSEKKIEVLPTIDTRSIVKIQPFDFLFIYVYSIDLLAAVKALLSSKEKGLKVLVT